MIPIYGLRYWVTQAGQPGDAGCRFVGFGVCSRGLPSDDWIAFLISSAWWATGSGGGSGACARLSASGAWICQIEQLAKTAPSGRSETGVELLAGRKTGLCQWKRGNGPPAILKLGVPAL